MAFDSLSEKLQNVFKNLRSKGRLTEADVKTALKEVKMALLEADVNFKVVKQFVKDVEERAVGQDVMNGLNPGQMVIKIVNEEMVRLMGSETAEITLQPGKAVTVIMMTGLQGAGKTTTAAKLAGKFKQKGKKVLLVAGDVYRPAAIEQKQVPGEEFETNNRMVAATKLQEEDSVVSVTMINGETDVVLQTTNGTFLRFPLEEISVLKKASRGVRGIRLAKNEELETVYLIGENPIIDYKGKEVHLNRLKLAKRDGKGSKVRLN